MDIETLVIVGLMIFSSGVMIYVNGWKKASVRIFYLVVVLIVYGLITYFFDQRGKEVLSIILLIIAGVFLYFRNKKGKSIW